MAVFRPFCAVRPSKEKAADVAALPYDVMTSAEARVMTKDAPLSFLHVDRAEIDLPEGTDLYSDEVYEKAAANLRGLIDDGVLIRDPDRCYYLYREIMDGRAQTGIVGCASIDEYISGTIKKHELTVAAKEADRIRHVDVCNANTGIIFLTFRNSPALEERMEAITGHDEPLYDFVSEDGVRHIVWKVGDPSDVRMFEESFSQIPALYIADGHHRTASAVRVGEKRRREHPGYTGEEEFNYFLAAAFPASQLSIWDYNRVVKDLNGLTEDAFLEKLSQVFHVTPLEQPEDGSEEALAALKPAEKHMMTLYMDGKWFSLKALSGTYDPDDTVMRLDVSILQRNVLSPILGIEDPRTDARISFVGGIRGMKELKRLVDNGAAAAFAMYPTGMDDLMAIADDNRIMPPKSTWFEPKLRSGLFIHELS